MNTRTWAMLAMLVAGVALGCVGFGNLGENLVYYWTPTEMVEAGSKARGATIRLGGMVEAGSVRNDGSTLSFRVTDGTTSVPVHTQAIPPAMFREGIGVVVEGSVDETGHFTSKRLMVKHDNQYKAPQPGTRPDIAAMAATLEGAP